MLSGGVMEGLRRSSLFTMILSGRTEGRDNHEPPQAQEPLPPGAVDGGVLPSVVQVTSGGIQRLHGGIPSFTLSIPSRYVHTVNETVHGDDVQACIDLLARYIEDAHNGKYAY